jgi:hypothetical protein
MIPGRREAVFKMFNLLRELERLVTTVVRVFTVAADAAGKDGKAAAAVERKLGTTAVADRSRKDVGHDNSGGRREAGHKGGGGRKGFEGRYSSSRVDFDTGGGIGVTDPAQIARFRYGTAPTDE